jgi:RNA polymerase sigma factor (sigma-70 family)
MGKDAPPRFRSGFDLDDASIHLVARWRQGDQQAAQELFERYVSRLIALAQSRLSSKLAGRIDAEDVVQSAYRSFFAAARDGRFQIQRGGELWRLLVATTLHKLHDQIKRHRAQKRNVQREQSLEDSLLGIEADLTQQPSPVEAVALVDEVQEVMRGLEPLHRRVLELRLEGYNLDEIGASIDRCPQTVRRILERIKKDIDQRYSQTTGT